MKTTFRKSFLRDLSNENSAVKNALRFVVQNAIEILVARAMRLRVFDDHVVIGELFAFRQVKAVQYTFEPFTGEVGPNIVSREPRAQGD